jgi:asparagine synthase (glutamine-hydrolysing)
MCGIVYSDPTRVASEHTLLAIRDALTHRGPDDACHYLAPGVALGARRLAILDLFDRGHMPMCTPDGRYWIPYNGEVFNHQQLRGVLKAQGYTFHSSTDTETILNLYALEGPAMLERLNGMFALQSGIARSAHYFWPVIAWALNRFTMLSATVRSISLRKRSPSILEGFPRSSTRRNGKNCFASALWQVKTLPLSA